MYHSQTIDRSFSQSYSVDMEDYMRSFLCDVGEKREGFGLDTGKSGFISRISCVFYPVSLYASGPHRHTDTQLTACPSFPSPTHK